METGVGIRPRDIHLLCVVLIESASILFSDQTGSFLPFPFTLFLIGKVDSLI